MAEVSLGFFCPGFFFDYLQIFKLQGIHPTKRANRKEELEELTELLIRILDNKLEPKTEPKVKESLSDTPSPASSPSSLSPAPSGESKKPISGRLVFWFLRI